jgi:N-acetylglutamate synthase-like GNAT family acetyltransferase
MTRAVQLRIATREDIPALSRLIADSARELSRGFYGESETEAAIRYVFGVDTALVDDGTYYVATVDGALAGCGGWSRRNTLYGGDQRPVGESALLDPSKDAARIRAFFVASGSARKGVGRALLEECTRAAFQSGFRSLTLMATLPGVPFYLASGFHEDEDVTDVLPDGTPLRFVRMSKPIAEQRHDE